MTRATRRLITITLTVTALVMLMGPAQAVHLFPLTPVGDPLGHDCEAALEAAPDESAAEVAVVGFNFIDAANGSTTSTITAGESVTWQWLADHCHSVTFSSDDAPEGTLGGENALSQPELVRTSEDGASFTATFDQPGTYEYICVHHASVGMTGTVEVLAS